MKIDTQNHKNSTRKTEFVRSSGDRKVRYSRLDTETGSYTYVIRANKDGENGTPSRWVIKTPAVLCG